VGGVAPERLVEAAVDHRRLGQPRRAHDGAAGQHPGVHRRVGRPWRLGRCLAMGGVRETDGDDAQRHQPAPQETAPAEMTLTWRQSTAA